MSRELPLWEEDESDVRLEYRLLSGHVLVEYGEIDRLCQKVQSVLGLGKPISIRQEVRAEWLPREKAFVVLEGKQTRQLIFARFGPVIAVFGPHKLFFSSLKWIRLSRKLKTRLAFVRQDDIDMFSYIVFRNGKRQCSAYWDRKGIHELEYEAMEFYLDRKLIYKREPEKGKLTEDILRFVSRDILIQIMETGGVSFVTPLSAAAYHEAANLRHVVFPVHNSVPPDYILTRIGIGR